MDSQPDVHNPDASGSAGGLDLFGDYDPQAGYDMLKPDGGCQPLDDSAVDPGAAETSDDVCQPVESPTKPASGIYRPVAFGPAAKKFRYNHDGGRPFEYKKLPCLQGRHLQTMGGASSSGGSVMGHPVCNYRDGWGDVGGDRWLGEN